MLCNIINCTVSEIYCIDSLDKSLQVAITDFRKIKSDLPVSIIIEFFRLHNTGSIKADTLGQLIEAINAYLIRRNICDMDSQNISKLFPTILRRVIDKCNGDYSDIVSVLNQEMVGNNAGTSGSYMPTDAQMRDFFLMPMCMDVRHCALFWTGWN